MSKNNKINSKNKGNRVELELAHILTSRFNKIFKRTPMSGAWGTANRQQDIREDAKQILSGDIITPKEFKFCIECKGRFDFNFWDMLNEDTKELEIDSWIWQAEEEAKTVNKEPLIYVKVNNRKPFVLFPKKLMDGKITYGDYTVMRFDYFLGLEDDFFFEGINEN